MRVAVLMSTYNGEKYIREQIDSITAECLDLMGIHNYRIIGCPSMFVNLNGILPSIGRPTCGKYQITITPGNSYLKTKLLQLGMREKC